MNDLLYLLSSKRDEVRDSVMKKGDNLADNLTV